MVVLPGSRSFHFSKNGWTTDKKLETRTNENETFKGN